MLKAAEYIVSRQTEMKFYSIRKRGRPQGQYLDRKFRLTAIACEQVILLRH